MGIVGHQDFWVAGAKIFLQRDPISAVTQPLLDIGVIDGANPTQDVEKLELEDADGGRKSVVDTAVSKITENYDVAIRNLNGENLSMFFLSNPPAVLSQLAEHKDVQHSNVSAGHLVKVHDNDSDSTPLYALGAVSGVYSGGALSTVVVTDINATAKTITTTEDTSALSAGEFVILRGVGLSNIENSRTYTVVSAVGAGPTVITVEETPAATEATITGSALVDLTDAGTIHEPDVDWELYGNDLVRGIIRLIPGGAIADGGISIVYSTAAGTGERIVVPQSFKGEVRGRMYLFWGRGDNAQQTVRECDVIVTPGASNITADDFSTINLNFQVVSDLTETQPAGRLVAVGGALPSSS